MSDDLNETLLEKLKSLSSKPNENLESLRSVAARIHSRAASQDKQIRERTLERLWRKNSGTLSLLMALLETVRDPIALCSVAGILHECVSAKSGKNRSPAVSQLVAMNSSQSLMKLVLQQQVKEAALAEPFLQELVWILAQVSQKDPKFSVKCRVSGCLRTFHSLVRAQYNSTKLLYPLLLVMKSLSKNSATTRVLVKDGVVSTMEKIFVSIGLSPNPKLRLALSVLTYLSKSRLCCTRIVKSGLLNHLFRIFERWERYDGKIRIKICSHTLATILHLCTSKLGRKSIRVGSGLQLLHKFSTSCPEEKCYDSLLSKVCNIINLCLEKKQMPIDDITSPAYFRMALPADSDLVSVHTSSSRETSPASDDDSGEEFLEDDDDDDTQDTEENKKAMDKSYTFSCPIQRSLEDLKGYASFFSELHSGRMSQGNILNRIASVSNESINFEDFKNLVQKPVLERFDSINGQDLSLEEIIGHHGKKLTSESVNSIEKGKSYSSVISSKKFTGSRAESEYIEEKRKISNDFMVKGLSSVAQITKISSFQKAYCAVASCVNSIIPFEKVAYPDMVGGDSVDYMEPLNVKDRKVCRAKILSCVERAINPSMLMNEVVYDLDALMLQRSSFSQSDSTVLSLSNRDEERLGNLDETKSHLCFESRFESGNLRKAIQIGPAEYDLILMPDVNATRHHQWFYFEISNMEAGTPYVFNIINCEKQNSQFNYGMKPLMYSVQEAVLGRPGWVRVGTDICYYRNSYQNPLAGKARSYLTATFTITFRHYYDVCYLAYHYPYTYSQLLAQIWKWSKTVDPTEIYFRAESLCFSLNSNEAPLLTITAPETELNSTMTRETVFLTSRVHPGESNSSWVMQGTLEYLLSSAAAADKLRRMYVFKIVPMLNMEGVINGCHRCGLTDEDLNRRWSHPNQHLHPVIYHTKGLIDYMTRVLKKPPYVFCDYHGHSRRKNVFLYGCSNMDSWNETDRSLPDNPVEYLMLPHLMQHFSPAFALPLCNFRVERGRESTARVTVWREFGIKRSYTMESSYCGCDRGLYQGHHLNTAHLKEVGASFCEALACLHDETSWRLELLQSGNQETNRFDLQQETCTEYTAESSDSDDSESTESNDEYHRL